MVHLRTTYRGKKKKEKTQHFKNYNCVNNPSFLNSYLHYKFTYCYVFWFTVSNTESVFYLFIMLDKTQLLAGICPIFGKIQTACGNVVLAGQASKSYQWNLSWRQNLANLEIQSHL